eukprot:CAMPEP_0172718790 /NCGR_PEP_ID=MMETSP1074-20121228/75128_1 /TAXON_ID=2916 /ORGANISM="Ceratium fusus, Strain PA161109" /LENGTH=201 /DNA_ID=CAMNT_0013544065 /DNA_START=720 /DNA_END=1326 /DNA_ORIENTATION=+
MQQPRSRGSAANVVSLMRRRDAACQRWSMFVKRIALYASNDWFLAECAAWLPLAIDGSAVGGVGVPSGEVAVGNEGGLPDRLLPVFCCKRNNASTLEARACRSARSTARSSFKRVNSSSKLKLLVALCIGPVLSHDADAGTRRCGAVLLTATCVLLLLLALQGGGVTQGSAGRPIATGVCRNGCASAGLGLTTRIALTDGA